ncbi:GNAT family N-acetyltransferase [Nocardioides sp.]|uniref:GNAT family N-acetyltransferase n=1 Tax=Nocardioides sp. TaxID=35761 RepID=UPI002C861AFC|nr:GNAT family N-acetyltransferase [Nocardioides sp.]HXH80321.1 GNAT family N-acetyltransferase [Nocardioides sp.]
MTSEAVSGVLDLRQVPICHPDAQLLVEAVQQEYVARYGSRDESPIDHTEFLEPRGAFFVGYLDGEPVVSGAWRRRDDVEVVGTTATAEVKRMYVVPSARGLGVARRMLAHLEATAFANGAGAVILETGTMQPEAIALYESADYEVVDGFGHYRDSPYNRCFAKACPADTPYAG